MLTNYELRRSIDEAQRGHERDKNCDTPCAVTNSTKTLIFCANCGTTLLHMED